MEKLYDYLPRELVTFLLVTVFSLLIGLSQRKISLKREGETTLFGTDRTFTFIGILGYLLYILDPTGYRLFMGGGAILGLLLGLNYYVKQSQYHVFGVTTIIIALITYCIAPIVATQPSWFYVMVIVTVLLFTELKHTFTELAQRMKNDEMITLAKFLAISGIILPMLPNENLIPGINLTPYSIWLATVVVSGISYLSYLLKRYVFHESGILVSGIVGGLYSSTATISVLARKSRKASVQDAPEYVAAMLLAVSMMFLRFLILIGIFSIGALTAIYPYLLIMSAVAAGTAWFLHSRWKRPAMSETVDEDEDGDRIDNALGHRHADFAEHLHLARAVQFCRLDHRIRNAAHEFGQDKDRKGGENAGQDDRPSRVIEVQPLRNETVGHQRDLIGHQHQNDIGEEDEAADFALETGKAVRGKQRNRDLPEHNGHSQNHRVPKLDEVLRVFDEHIGILVKGDHVGNQLEVGLGRDEDLGIARHARKNLPVVCGDFTLGHERVCEGQHRRHDEDDGNDEEEDKDERRYRRFPCGGKQQRAHRHGLFACRDVHGAQLPGDAGSCLRML